MDDTFQFKIINSHQKGTNLTNVIDLQEWSIKKSKMKPGCLCQSSAFASCSPCSRSSQFYPPFHLAQKSASCLSRDNDLQWQGHWTARDTRRLPSLQTDGRWCCALDFPEPSIFWIITVTQLFNGQGHTCLDIIPEQTPTCQSQSWTQLSLPPLARVRPSFDQTGGRIRIC